MSRRRVVVTGVGVVSPIGVGFEAYLESLAAGRSGIGPISLFDASRFSSRLAGEVRDFDLDRIMSLPTGLRGGLTDRKVVFAIAAAHMALTGAFGEVGSIPYLPEQRAISMGVGVEVFRMDDIVPFCSPAGEVDAVALSRHLETCSVLDHFRIPADIGPATIGTLARVQGPRRVNVGACVASAQAIGEAYRLLRRGQAEMVIAGGSDSMVNPLAVAGFSLLDATSRSNELGPAASRPFDRKRDGFVLGEGAAVLILEEAAAAEQRGATILAEVVGYGTSMDAYKITDPAEDGAGAVLAMRRALAEAHLPASAVEYVNAHGTATIKNDRVETKAIRDVFKEHASRIAVSSTKSMIGHCIAAAGALEFAASLLGFQRDLIPPTINLENPDPECDLDYVPGTARSARVQVFMSNSFGFGGQNACLVGARYTASRT